MNIDLPNTPDQPTLVSITPCSDWDALFCYKDDDSIRRLPIACWALMEEGTYSGSMVPFRYIIGVVTPGDGPILYADDETNCLGYIRNSDPIPEWATARAKKISERRTVNAGEFS